MLLKENQNANNGLDKWMTYEEVQKIFNYRPTQMSLLLKKVEVAKIGKRKFITKESIEKLLRDNLL
jgi:hypothetical protein